MTLRPHIRMRLDAEYDESARLETAVAVAWERLTDAPATSLLGTGGPSRLVR